MDKVVYWLGAGFSAPLGLPVMSNFLIKSKDLYFSDPEKYEHFLDVFSTIDKLSVIKNYYHADLFNIEEILSILDMNAQLGGERLKDSFLRYIRDVVSYFMPPISRYQGNLPSNWADFVFGYGPWNRYGYFVCSLHNILIEQYELNGRPAFRWKRLQSPAVRYDVISLNYDLVLEWMTDFVNSEYPSESPLRFRREESDTFPGPSEKPWLAKLHGSADSGVIIPPTWSKSFSQEIEPQWQAAHQLLREANHIRILGYSLPIADAYVKYLFKSAVMESKHLKTIDVICLDSNGSTERRYEDFIGFNYYRFRNRRIEDYLDEVAKRLGLNAISTRSTTMEFNKLEIAHAEFMNSS